MRKCFFWIIVILAATPAIAQYNFYLYEKTDKFNLGPWLRYNKADGGFTGVTTQYFFSRDFYLSGRGGYAFSGKYPRYAVEVKKIFPSGNNEYILSIDYHNLTFSKDQSIIPDIQNSLGALLFRSDFYDHYESRGGLFRFGKNWSGTVKVNLFAGMEQYENLRNRTKKSFFDWGGDKRNGKKIFAPSPPVAEGDDYFAGIDYEIDFRPSPLAFVSAWYFKGKLQSSRLVKKVFDGDFSYHRADVTFKRYQKLFARHKLVVGLRLASHQGKTTFESDTTGVISPQDQFLFDAGGISTLRGYRYREFQNGNRLVLLNVDYAFNSSFLPKTPLTKIWGIGWIFKNFDLIFFTDAGYVWLNQDNRSLLNFDGIKLKDFKANAGTGLAMSDWIRFDFAWALKSGIATKRGDWQFNFRIVQKL